MTHRPVQAAGRGRGRTTGSAARVAPPVPDVRGMPSTQPHGPVSMSCPGWLRGGVLSCAVIAGLLPAGAAWRPRRRDSVAAAIPTSPSAPRLRLFIVQYRVATRSGTGRNEDRQPGLTPQLPEGHGGGNARPAAACASCAFPGTALCTCSARSATYRDAVLKAPQSPTSNTPAVEGHFQGVQSPCQEPKCKRVLFAMPPYHAMNPDSAPAVSLGGHASSASAVRSSNSLLATRK